MVFEEVDIPGHLVNFLLDFLEFGVDILVVGVKLGLTLDSLLFLFSLDGHLVHTKFL